MSDSVTGRVLKISKIERSAIDPDALAFAPIACMNCNFDGFIPNEYFLVTPDLETENDYIELEQIAKKQLGHAKFTQMHCNLGSVIITSRCPQCGSTDIFEDF